MQCNDPAEALVRLSEAKQLLLYRIFMMAYDLMAVTYFFFHFTLVSYNGSVSCLWFNTGLKFHQPFLSPCQLFSWLIWFPVPKYKTSLHCDESHLNYFAYKPVYRVELFISEHGFSQLCQAKWRPGIWYTCADQARKAYLLFANYCQHYHIYDRSIQEYSLNIWLQGWKLETWRFQQ